jgi:hypothetical protein
VEKMAKASIELPNGTAVVIEGTPEEVHKLLEFYGGSTSKRSTTRKGKAKSAGRTASERIRAQSEPDLAEIINLIRNSEDADKIETNILDRTSQVNRVLLPLYIIQEHMDNAFGLTSGDISKITADLGIPVQAPNVSNTLSGTASRYVMPDKLRKRGQVVRYKLSRRGVKYLTSVIRGTEDGD